MTDRGHPAAAPLRPGGVQWPSDHPVADQVGLPPPGVRCRLVLIVNLGFLEERHPEGYPRLPAFGGFGDRPFPNVPRISQREYGNRVGLSRLLSLFDGFGVPSAVSIDAFTAQALPHLVARCLDNGCEVIAGGLSESRPLTSAMHEEQQRMYIRDATSVIREAVGYQPAGWMSPAFSGTSTTAGHLADAGYIYSCDWPNGDVAGRFHESGLRSLPVYIDLDDETAFYRQGLTPAQYETRFLRVLAQYHDEPPAGSLLVLNLRPWVMGQPFRVASMRRVLERVLAADVEVLCPRDIFGVPPARPPARRCEHDGRQR